MRRKKKYGRYLSDISLKAIWTIGLSILLVECVFLDYFWFV